MENIKVLYVDDDIKNLNAYKATFRFEYRVLIAAIPAEALKELESHPDINIVLCGTQLQGHSSAAFLEQVRLRFPRQVRMLTTHSNDLEPLADAVNRGNIFRFIKQPWSAVEMRSAIYEGYKYYLTSLLLAQKNEELEGAYRVLNEFSYNVTHGLRDPILSVLSLVEIAGHMDNVPPDVKEILDMVGLAMVQLDNYVENTHDYHQLKNAPMEVSNISFSELADDMTENYRNEKDQKNITFKCKINQEENFKSSAPLVSIIVNNLLSNAFKYQRNNISDKFVELDVTVENGAATIAVKDNGIGIITDQIKHIFEPLYRATSVEYGSGLGLCNVKDALHKLNGEIFVDTMADVGSTFKVIIPGK